MAELKAKAVLVLGGTGPAGICLIRELLHRKHTTVVYARNPSKIPKELSSNPLLTVMEGEMSDHTSLYKAIELSSVVISLLGPHISNRNISPTLYSDFYAQDIFPLLHRAGVSRILAMGTISISRPEDSWSLFPVIGRRLMRLLARNLYQNMQNIASTFEKEEGLDWTVFRIAAIPGGCNEDEWKTDREDGPLYAGPIGASGWTSSVKRAALAKWLVDHMEPNEWVRQMPAISRQAV